MTPRWTDEMERYLETFIFCPSIKCKRLLSTSSSIAVRMRRAYPYHPVTRNAVLAKTRRFPWQVRKTQPS